jgi:putative hydrolase of the HAD superfamily
MAESSRKGITKCLRNPPLVAMTPGMDAFGHIETWIFDLDNTLYPPRANLFAQIDERMGAYIMRLIGCDAVEARRVQKRFFHDHGTTLRGLMDGHGVAPADFLSFVHDIDMGVLEADSRMAAAFDKLPGRKLVFTNADTAYAEKVLDRLGLGSVFEAVYDIHAMDYRPKPDPNAYHGFCTAHGIRPERALFVEDMARNLVPAKAMGMTTVWADNGAESGSYQADHDSIDHRIADVGDWLHFITTGVEA